MSYSGWYGYCPKCGYNKGTYKVHKGTENNEIRQVIEYVKYECDKCHWIGNYNQILNEEQWINQRRFKILNEILNETK